MRNAHVITSQMGSTESYANQTLVFSKVLALYLPELFSRILVCRSQAVLQLPALWSLRHVFGKAPRHCCVAWFCHVDGYHFTLPIAAREWLTFFLDWNDIKVHILSSFYKMSNSMCLINFHRCSGCQVFWFKTPFLFYAFMEAHSISTHSSEIVLHSF